MVVPDRQMNPFIKAVTEMEERITFLQPDELELQKGDTVRVHGGPLDGQIGEIVKLKGKRKKRLVLRLMDFAAISISTVEPEYVELIKPDEV
jgi:transcription antitermination factor NusG